MNPGHGNHISDDVLIDVALKLLPPPDQVRWLNHLRACSDCERRFTVVAGDAERTRIASGAQQTGRASGMVDQPAAWRAVAPLLAAAAMLIVATLVSFNAPNRTALVYRLPIEGNGATQDRSGDGTLHSRIARAYDAYRNDQWSEVVTNLSSVEASIKSQHAGLVLASAWLNVGRASEAERLLDSMGIDWIPQPDRDRAYWILSLCYSRTGKSTQARDIWVRMANDSEEFRSEAHRRLSEASPGSGAAPSSTP